MKKAVLLASLAVLLPSWSAMALQEGARRPVSVAGSPAGMITAFYVSNVNGPLGRCLYDVDWESPFQAAGSVMCQIAEQKVLGHTSCLVNRNTPSFVTIVRSVEDTKYSACHGFDQYGIPQVVSLTLGEGLVTPTLNGLAIYQYFPYLPRPISIF
jgi:hypothetical protein